MTFSRALRIAIALALVLSLGGCAFFDIFGARVDMELDPSLEHLSRAKPENNVFVMGRLGGDRGSVMDMAVLAVSDRYKKDEVVSTHFMNTPSLFIMYLPKADYRIYVLADLDHDGVFRGGEMVGRAEGLVKVQADGGYRLMELAAIATDPTRPGDVGFPLEVKPDQRVSSLTLKGITVELDDPIFASEIAESGQFDPASFMAKVPSMLYTVEGDVTRTPVVFVHGANGSPENWWYLANRLKDSGFHPWFFYYPSGERIDLNSEILYHILEERLPYDRMVLVGHSLGGLVSKGFLSKYNASRRSDYIKLFISLDTSYGGVESAGEGVKKLKYVPPVWKDIATGSAFLRNNVDAWPMPEGVDFRLFFGFKSDKAVMLHSGDGAITLESQLNPFAQEASTRMYGFYTTHAGILTSKGAADRFMRILEESGLGKK